MDVQEKVFDDLYLGPAFAWAAKYGFALPIVYLTIADSFLHSGTMFPWLMDRFEERKPSDGGDEKKWIEAYLDARRDWLATHSSQLLRNTVYRCDCYLREIKRNNWDLAEAPVDMHGTQVGFTYADDMNINQLAQSGPGRFARLLVISLVAPPEIMRVVQVVCVIIIVLALFLYSFLWLAFIRGVFN